MVCSLGSAKMAALVRLQAVEMASQTVIEEVGHQKLSAQYMNVFREADERNFLDEEDMHIFGLRPMTDPLNLVCCNTCKKPIKSSQYTVHAELCISLNSRAEIQREPHGHAVNKKPPRKEKKKLKTAQTKSTSIRGPKKLGSINSDVINVSESSYVIGQIQVTPGDEAKQNAHLNGTSKAHGSRVDPYNVESSEYVTLHPSKPVKRRVAENPSNSGIKSLTTTTAKVHPYVPAPLATKIYYSQGNHSLRRAIGHMFYGEASKGSCSGASNMEVVQVNEFPAQTSSPNNFNHEYIVNQQRDGHFLHVGETPNQIIAANSELYSDKFGGTVSSMNIASQLPVNNTLGHYMSNPRSFAGNAENGVRSV